MKQMLIIDIILVLIGILTVGLAYTLPPNILTEPYNYMSFIGGLMVGWGCMNIITLLFRR